MRKVLQICLPLGLVTLAAAGAPPSHERPEGLEAWKAQLAWLTDGAWITPNAGTVREPERATPC